MNILKWLTIHAGDWVELDPARSAAIIGYRITGGRRSPWANGDPLTATITLAATVAPPEIGETVRLQLHPQFLARLDPVENMVAWTQVRFSGEVTDVVADPRAGHYAVTAAGAWGRRARALVKPNLRGIVTDVALATDALTQVGVPEWLRHLPPDGAHRPKVVAPDAPVAAGSLLHSLAAGMSGIVFEHRSGIVQLAPLDHRREVPVSMALWPGHLLRGLTWAKRAADVVNSASVQLGDGTEVQVADAASVAARGEYAASTSTHLAELGPAYTAAVVQVARRRDPAWQLPAVQVDLLNGPHPFEVWQLIALLHYQTGDRFLLVDLPAPGGTLASFDLHVEGFTETLTLAPGVTPLEDSLRRLTWRMAYNVSERAVAGVSLRWVDVRPAATWADVDPAADWLDAGRTDTDTLT